MARVRVDSMTGPVRFWQPRARQFRTVRWSFTTGGALTSALDRVAVPYLFPIYADNDSDHLGTR